MNGIISILKTRTKHERNELIYLYPNKPHPNFIIHGIDKYYYKDEKQQGLEHEQYIK